MAIRKFLASTTREAMLQVRRELGDDAVIIANRRIGNRVEILAAAPDAVDALVERSETRAMPATRDAAMANERVARADGKPKVEAFQDFVRRQMQADAEAAPAPRAPAARHPAAKAPPAKRGLAGNPGVAMYHDVADIEEEEFIAQPVRASERAPQRATAAQAGQRRGAAAVRAHEDELARPAPASARAQATTLPHSHRAQQIETVANAGDPAVFRRRPAQVAAQPRSDAMPTRAPTAAPKVDILLEASPAEAAHPLAREPAPRLAPASEAAPIATGHAVVPPVPGVRSQAAPIAIAARLRDAWMNAAAELAAKQAAPAAPVGEAAKASDAQARVSNAVPASATAPAPHAAAPSFATWSWQAQFIPARVVPQVVAPMPVQPIAQQAIAPVAPAAAMSVQNAVTPVAPQAAALVAPQAVAPVAPQGASPVVRQTPASVEQQATAPAIQQTAGPVAPQAVASVAQQSAVVQQAATPVAQPTASPVAQQVVAPLAQQGAAPIAQQAAAPAQHVVTTPQAVAPAAPPPIAETPVQSTTSAATQVAAPANPSPAQQLAAQPAVESQLLAELHSMRDMLRQQIASLASKPASEPAPATPAATRVTTRLLTAGFSAEVARRIASHAPQHAEAAQTQEWLQEVLAHNIRCVDAADGIVERAGRPATPGQIFALVGPTGVGKTTTVAKLAARFAVRHGTSALGLITLDSYRVAAPEQLRAFGRILGTPVHLAQDAATLRELLATMVHKRLVLIDTCGVSQRDDRLGEMLDLLAGAGTGSRPVQRVLLMNSASHVETLEETARAWRAHECVGAILTKLDEATRIGGSLDVSLRHRLALLGLTNGQRVPEDWHAANGKLLAHLALKPAAQLFELAQEEGAALVQAHATAANTQGTAHV